MTYAYGELLRVDMQLQSVDDERPYQGLPLVVQQTPDIVMDSCGHAGIGLHTTLSDG